jgi:hypothetical protein
VPASFPEPHPLGASVPSGAHAVDFVVADKNGRVLAEGQGYLELQDEERCSLDWTLREEVTEGDAQDFRIVKNLQGPAFIKAESREWRDTRDPNAWTPTVFTLVNPVGVATSGETWHQSLCFLTALPALTRPPGLPKGTFAWDKSAIDAFVNAANQSFIHKVLSSAQVDRQEYDKVAGAVTSLVELPTSRFPEAASPLSLSGTETEVLLAYSVGRINPLRVHLTLTHLPQRWDIASPYRARAWEETVAAEGEASGMPGLLQRYFSVR